MLKKLSKYLDLDLPEVICCDNCKYKNSSNATHLKKISHAAEMRFWKKSDRRRCYQSWSSINGEHNATLATNCKDVRIRNYSQIKTDVVIGHCCS